MASSKYANVSRMYITSAQMVWNPLLPRIQVNSWNNMYIHKEIQKTVKPYPVWHNYIISNMNTLTA